jgi:hypothetical protein
LVKGKKSTCQFLQVLKRFLWERTYAARERGDRRQSKVFTGTGQDFCEVSTQPFLDNKKGGAFAPPFFLEKFRPFGPADSGQLRSPKFSL